MRPILNLLIGIDGERICLTLQFSLFHWGFCWVNAYGTRLVECGPLSLVFYRPRKLESVDEYFDRKLDTNTESD